LIRKYKIIIKSFGAYLEQKINQPAEMLDLLCLKFCHVLFIVFFNFYHFIQLFLKISLVFMKLTTKKI